MTVKKAVAPMKKRIFESDRDCKVNFPFPLKFSPYKKIQIK